MAWEIQLTEQAERWFMGLGARDADRIATAIDKLEQRGPGLARPLVDSVKGSRHHNMKELRAVGGNLRALFAFDPRRNALILVGGDKTNDWKGWYQRTIPVADKLYDEHLRRLGRNEGWPPPRTGGQSADKDR